MNLQIIGHHLEVTPAMREAVSDGLRHIMRTLLSATGVRVFFAGKKKTGRGQSIRIEVKPRKGKTLRVKKHLSPDQANSPGALYQVIREAFSKLHNIAQGDKTRQSARAGRRVARESRRTVMDKSLD